MSRYTAITESSAAVAENRARAITAASENLVSSIVNLWRAQYENFWQIRKFAEDGEGNAQITVTEVQAYLDAMGAAAIEQLTESQGFVANYTSDIPVLYQSSPFNLDVVSEPGRIIVGDMVVAWVTELGLDEE